MATIIPTSTSVPRSTVPITKLGRFVVMREFSKMMESITEEAEISPKDIDNMLGKALVCGSRVSRGESQLLEFANNYNLDKLNKHDALIALNGGLLSSEHGFSETEKTLQYLLDGSEKARQLLGVRATSSKSKSAMGAPKTTVDVKKLDAAVRDVLAGKPSGSTFVWDEVSKMLVDKYEVSAQAMKAYSARFIFSKICEQAGKKGRLTFWRLGDSACPPSMKPTSLPFET